MLVLELGCSFIGIGFHIYYICSFVHMKLLTIKMFKIFLKNIIFCSRICTETNLYLQGYFQDYKIIIVCTSVCSPDSKFLQERSYVLDFLFADLIQCPTHNR